MTTVLKTSRSIRSFSVAALICIILLVFVKFYLRSCFLTFAELCRVGLNLNFEFESAHELLMNLNLNSTSAKSMNLNLNSVFSKSMSLNLILVFSKSVNLNLNLKIKKMNGSNQYLGYGGGASRPLVPSFWLTKNTAIETSRNDKTTDNDGKRNNYV